MISADAVPFMAFATKLFIGALTTLAWKLSTQRSKRNTLQVKDLKEAVASSSKFDFLIDTIDSFDETSDMSTSDRPVATLASSSPPTVVIYPTGHEVNMKGCSGAESTGTEEDSFACQRASLTTGAASLSSHDSLTTSCGSAEMHGTMDYVDRHVGCPQFHHKIANPTTEAESLPCPVASASVTEDFSDLIALLDD